MNNDQIQSKIDVLKLENVQLLKHLKKYTLPTRAKKYY